MKSDGLTGSDCFCTIYLDPANIGRTKIIRNTQDPVWNFSSILSIFRTNIQIHINVKDADDVEDFVEEQVGEKVNLDGLPFGDHLSKGLESVGGIGGLGGLASGFLDKLKKDKSALGKFLGDVDDLEDKISAFGEKIKDEIPVETIEEQFKSGKNDHVQPLGNCPSRHDNLSVDTPRGHPTWTLIPFIPFEALS